MARKPQKGALSDAAKNYAVVCFAHCLTPTQVADAVNERFGTTIDKRAAQRYDPTSVYGSMSLGNARKKLFDESRALFLDEVNEIPIANKATRLKQLQLHYNRAVDIGNVGMALRILEQAAKEKGGEFTNERKVHHTGKLEVEAASEDEVRGSLANTITSVLEDWRGELERERMTKH